MRDKIDAREVFEFVQSELENMLRDDLFDLNLLWDHVSKKQKPDQLYPLFLGFEDVLTKLGLRVQQPRAAERLSRAIRDKLLHNFNSSLQPKPSSMPKKHREWFARDDTPMPGRVALGRFRPGAGRATDIDDKARRAMAEAVVWAFKNTGAGPHFSSGQLSQTIVSKFDEFCDGETFQIQPLIDGVVRLPGVRAPEMLVPVYRLESFFSAHGLVLGDTELAFDDETRVRAKAQADASEDLLILYPLAGRKDPHAQKARSSRPAAGRVSFAPAGAPTEKRVPKVLIGAFVAALILALISLVVLRPVHVLDTDDYPMIPLVDVRLKEGSFHGVLDDTGWVALPLSDRKNALTQFEAKLREDGRVRVRIYDGAGKLMIYGNDDKPYLVTESMLEQ